MRPLWVRQDVVLTLTASCRAIWCNAVPPQPVVAVSRFYPLVPWLFTQLLTVDSFLREFLITCRHIYKAPSIKYLFIFRCSFFRGRILNLLVCGRKVSSRLSRRAAWQTDASHGSYLSVATASSAAPQRSGFWQKALRSCQEQTCAALSQRGSTEATAKTPVVASLEVLKYVYQAFKE